MLRQKTQQQQQHKKQIAIKINQQQQVKTENTAATKDRKHRSDKTAI